MTVWMASAAVVLPEPLPPENRLIGPNSNSPLGMLPQLSSTRRLRNTLDLAGGCAASCLTIGALAGTALGDERLDGFVADEVDDHGMHADPRFRLLQVVVLAIFDQLQLAQALEHVASLGGLLRQAAPQPVLHRKADRFERLGGKTPIVELALADGFAVLRTQHENERHFML